MKKMRIALISIEDCHYTEYYAVKNSVIGFPKIKLAIQIINILFLSFFLKVRGLFLLFPSVNIVHPEILAHHSRLFSSPVAQFTKHANKQMLPLQLDIA